MAIQFSCSHCGQPIEVDDEHAGQQAACPYCRSVVKVPIESTLRPDGAIAARPAGAAATGGAPAPGEPASHPAWEAPSVTETTARRQAAITYGNYALICGIIVIIVFGVAVVYVAMIGAKYGTEHPDEDLSLDRMAEVWAESPGAMWVSGAQCGAMVFALVGLALAIVSLTRDRRDNWRGWVALVLCCLPLLCSCFGFVQALIAGPVG